MSAQSPGLQKISRAIPVILQASGLVGFIAAQILWVFFRRPEPEFMGIMATVAATGYIGQGIQGLIGSTTSGPPPPELQPPVLPRQPPVSPPSSGETP